MARRGKPLRPDYANPEQHFGLVAFDLGEPDFSRATAAAGAGRARRVETAADAGFFWLRATLDHPLEHGERLTVGFDTHGDDLGESTLPNGQRARLRCELAVTVESPSEAQLWVAKAYDLFGIWRWESEDGQQHRSVPADAGEWAPARWINNREHESADGLHRFPRTAEEIGALSIAQAGQQPTQRDAVIIEGDTATIRLPWTLRQFVDPATLTAMHDDRSTPERETAVSEGIAAAVAIGGDIVETGRFRWELWDEAPP